MSYMSPAEMQRALYRAMMPPYQTNNTTKSDNDEWVWVTGYKGTDKDMKCHGGFQYEFDRCYDIPEDEEVRVCFSGFHLCLELQHVFSYFSFGKSNRFFEVRALIREADLLSYGSGRPYLLDDTPKLAAKSIKFVRELDVEEIYAELCKSDSAIADGWTREDMIRAAEGNPEEVNTAVKIRNLVRLGYAQPLAEYITKYG